MVQIVTTRPIWILIHLSCSGKFDNCELCFILAFWYFIKQRNAFDVIWSFDKSNQAITSIVLGPTSHHALSHLLPVWHFGYLLLLACGLRISDTPSIRCFLPGNPAPALAAFLQRFSGCSFCDSWGFLTSSW